MCGRFSLIITTEALALLFGLDMIPPDFAPRFNIAPTQPVLTIRARVRGVVGDLRSGPAGLEPVFMQWGLVPSWAKDPKMGARMINARADTVAEKPAYRTALKRRRCLIPASGFYEWAKTGKAKRPHYIRLRGGAPFAMAGLWETWSGGGESALESFTIITTEANALIAPLHDRMPVIIKPEHFSLWTDPTIQVAERVTPLLKPYDPEAMELWPVSTRVNIAFNDDAECLLPVEASETGELDLTPEPPRRSRKKKGHDDGGPGADDAEGPSFF